MYCLNAPAYAISGEIAEIGIRFISPESWLFTGYLFFYVYWGFFVAGAAFWWWVGYQLDKGLWNRSRVALTGRVSYLKAGMYGVIVLLSLAMARHGLMLYRVDVIPRSIAIAEMIWGLALAGYCLTLFYYAVAFVKAPEQSVGL
jgi:hypothetical protein